MALRRSRGFLLSLALVALMVGLFEMLVRTAHFSLVNHRLIRINQHYKRLLKYESDNQATAKRLPGRIDPFLSGDPHIVRILGWTWKFSFQKNWFPQTNEEHVFDMCNLGPNEICEYTSNQSILGSSDAVLFKATRIRDIQDLPSYKHPSQKWIFYESEPPVLTWALVPNLDKDIIRDKFNLTATISFDSDIPVKLSTECKISEVAIVANERVDFTQGKTRLVAWFVSNCNTSSKREDYVKELQKYIQVDVYGACGPYKCGSQSEEKNRHNSNCYEELLHTTYKFYLSFENSLCEDYVTEKLTRLYLQSQINVIPIVMGLENYSNYLPAGSYVDVRDFPSPKALAEFLLELNQDNQLYNMYALRKNALRCKSQWLDREFRCRLCRYLHQHREERQFAGDVVEYWSEENKCMTPEEFHRTRKNHFTGHKSLLLAYNNTK